MLTAVAATSASNAWAVGYTRNSDKALIVRWNGTAWSRCQAPPWPLQQPPGVAATSVRNAWAVGDDLNALILLHWNGTAWK